MNANIIEIFVNLGRPPGGVAHSVCRFPSHRHGNHLFKMLELEGVGEGLVEKVVDQVEVALYL